MLLLLKIIAYYLLQAVFTSFCLFLHWAIAKCNYKNLTSQTEPFPPSRHYDIKRTKISLKCPPPLVNHYVDNCLLCQLLHRDSYIARSLTTTGQLPDASGIFNAKLSVWATERIMIRITEWMLDLQWQHTKLQVIISLWNSAMPETHMTHSVRKWWKEMLEQLHVCH